MVVWYGDIIGIFSTPILYCWQPPFCMVPVRCGFIHCIHHVEWCFVSSGEGILTQNFGSYGRLRWQLPAAPWLSKEQTMGTGRLAYGARQLELHPKITQENTQKLMEDHQKAIDKTPFSTHLFFSQQNPSSFPCPLWRIDVGLMALTPAPTSPAPSLGQHSQHSSGSTVVFADVEDDSGLKNGRFLVWLKQIRMLYIYIYTYLICIYIYICNVCRTIINPPFFWCDKWWLMDDSWMINVVKAMSCLPTIWEW